MTAEETLYNRIHSLTTNTLNRLPIPRALTLIVDKYIDPFSKEIVQMAKEYTEAKTKEQNDRED